MARIDPTSPEFLSAKSKAAELVRRLGSVNKASEALTEALGDGAIYPNRLHGLLSDDITRTINARTFDLLRRGLTALEATGIFIAPEPPEMVQLTLSLVERWRASARTEAALRELAESVNQPVAVVRHALAGAGVFVQAPLPAITLATSLRDVQVVPDSARVPDYSFQDAAVDQCLAVFRRDPKRRAGVVVPTGGGKTDIALRIALAKLKENADDHARVIWVTHRQALRDQARDRLQVMLSRQVKGLSPEDIRLFGEQIVFVMLSDLPEALLRCGTGLRLIVIDEAHHAAAVSYDPAFDLDPGAPVLALTATPNRTDGQPIRIDEIAFTITFRELTERGVILRPEIERFPVEGFDWSDDAVDRLAGHILAGGGVKYHKVLIIAPQVEKVGRIYELIKKRLAEDETSFFAPEDVHYISSHGNSAGTSNHEFLAEFRQKRNAIIVSAQLLLEGYDDPLIDTVVITYRTESVIMLMQAAGRCVRYSPGKKSAYVIQAADERIAYFFDHRWLYQDLSDFPRPQLLDVTFADPSERDRHLREILVRHGVAEPRAADVVEEVNALPISAEFQLLLAGEPYYGSAADFERLARWHVCVLTPATRAVYVEVYNGLCALGRRAAEINVDSLVSEVAGRHSIAESRAPSSPWILLFSLALSLQKALMEVHDIDRSYYYPGGRLRPTSKATSWLKYVTFQHRPVLAQAILDFTAEAVNADVVREALIREPTRYAALVRQPLPVGGYEVFCLEPAVLDHVRAARAELTARLAAVSGAERWAQYQGWRLAQPPLPLPPRFYDFLGHLTRTLEWELHLLDLTTL